jgi:hypothetical protein
MGHLVGNHTRASQPEEFLVAGLLYRVGEDQNLDVPSANHVPKLFKWKTLKPVIFDDDKRRGQTPAQDNDLGGDVSRARENELGGTLQSIQGPFYELPKLNRTL